MTNGRAYDEGSNVLVRFHHARHESEKAHLLMFSADDEQGIWFPKSQIAHLDLDANEVWIPLWLAEKKGLDYD